MVYRGIPSKACLRCRRRKLRCSQQEPQCSQCVNAGEECSGYRDQLELMFCDESASVIEKANRSNAASSRSGSLSSASSSRTHKKSESPPARGKAKIVESSLATRPKRLPDLDTDFLGEMFGAFGGFGNEGAANPFDAMAVAMQADMNYLNQYCSSDLYPILVPLGRGVEGINWLPSVITDQLIFYFALWKTSTRYAMLHPEETTVHADVVRYYQKTVSLLNERLRDPTSAVSNESIKVVLGLASKAIAERNAAEATIHIAGLRRMLSQTGPQELSGLSPRLQEAVFWHDLCYTAAFTDPSISAFPSPIHPPQINSSISTLPLLTYFSPNTTMATLGSGFQFLTHLTPSLPLTSLISLLSELRNLTIVAEFCPTTSTGQSGSYDELPVITQRHDQVITALHLLDLDTPDTPPCDAPLLKSIRLVALIYTSIALQCNHPSSIPLAWLDDLQSLLQLQEHAPLLPPPQPKADRPTKPKRESQRHKNASASPQPQRRSQKQTRTTPDHRNSPLSASLAELNTWMLFTGSVACLPFDSDSALRQWFFGRLADAIVRLGEASEEGFASEDGLRRLLGRFLWVEGRCRRFGEFWAVVEPLL